jgi:GMP synthase (glutamine-hydrolysing)
VLALQCHLEADPREIERWLVGHANELVQAGVDPCVLREQARGLQDSLPKAAAAVFSQWLDGIEANPTGKQP